MSDDKIREALLPCPFCGSNSYIEQGKSEPCQLHGERTTTYRVVAMHTDPKFSNESNAKRKDCPIRPSVTRFSREDAIAAWNTRPALQASSEAKDNGDQCSSCAPDVANGFSNADCLCQQAPSECSRKELGEDEVIEIIQQALEDLYMGHVRWNEEARAAYSALKAAGFKIVRTT